jgi:hypothetical protein
MVNPYRFYTYAYLREDKTPYYIGKGQKYRIYEKKGKPCNVPKYKSRIIYLKQNITEEEAFQHEKYMISVFGRKDLGTGILHNRTDGGDGASGAIISKETRLKLSLIHKGEKCWNNGVRTIRSLECPGKGWIKGSLSNTTSGKKWWNDESISVMSKECPGEGWKRGRIVSSNKEKRWWNNGIRNTMSKECPGEGWKSGKIKIQGGDNGNKGNKCWNNGVINIVTKKYPGEGWVRGRVGNNNKGKTWWNNEIISTKSKECPGEGWKRGRIKK